MTLKPLRIALCAALALAAPMSAFAQTPIEVGVGASMTREDATTPVAMIAWLPEWRQTAHGVLRWDIGGVYVNGRDNTRFDLAEDAGVVHGGLRYERNNGFTAGFGAGVQFGRTDALSGNPQFVSTIGWRWERFALLARHISNGSLKEPNDGETMLMATWRFR